MGQHKATVVDRARRVEEHDAAPLPVSADVREERHRRTWVKAPHEGSGAPTREVRRAIPSLSARPERWPARALLPPIGITSVAARGHEC
jgi:hypothetical protein